MKGTKMPNPAAVYKYYASLGPAIMLLFQENLLTFQKVWSLNVNLCHSVYAN